MEKKNRFCQSCGMPINKDPQAGGTDADGAKNTKYCSYCYLKGAFTFVGTAEQMQEFCRKKMIENGHSKFMSWLFTRTIPRLERWK